MQSRRVGNEGEDGRSTGRSTPGPGAYMPSHLFPTSLNSRQSWETPRQPGARTPFSPYSEGQGSFARTRPFAEDQAPTRTPEKNRGSLRPEAPPVDSLYDIVQPPSFEVEGRGGVQREEVYSSGDMGGVASDQAFGLADAALGGGVGAGSELSEANWVTVFGFPPSQASYILKYFQNYGEIVRHHMNPGQCNWIHLQYQTKLQAQMALSKNGKIVGGNLMVGVVPCTQIITPTKAAVSDFPRPLNPQAQRTKAPRGHEVEIYGAARAPTPRDSIWHKFTEYVLGM
jgi:hypothetical protein